MFLNTLFCSHLILIKWLQNHLIPCPFKAITGIDCPGCGFQRSVMALLQGHLDASLHLYPATIPLIATGAFTIIEARLGFDQKGYLKKTLYIFTAVLITGAYAVKMSRYF